MPSDVPGANSERVDPAMVAAIAREVVARLKGTTTWTSTTNETAASIKDQIVTVSVVEQLMGSPAQAFVQPHAIVTPAARDEARRRGITILRATDMPIDQQPNHARLEITDASDPERADAVRSQLARRSLGVGAAKIVLSDTPAREVFRQCSVEGETAVMIGSVSDVHRFADELTPTVWVLDMKRLNISSAVNVIAQITPIEKQPR